MAACRIAELLLILSLSKKVLTRIKQYDNLYKLSLRNDNDLQNLNYFPIITMHRGRQAEKMENKKVLDKE